MRLASIPRPSVLLPALCLTLAACGSSGGGTDPVFPDRDSVITEIPQNEVFGPPTCTITKPTANKIMSEAIPDSKVVQVTAADPAGVGVTRVVLAFKVDAETVIVADIKDVPAGGKITTTVDTSGVKDGSRIFVCQAVTGDGRSGAAGVGVTVDNNPPVINLVGGSTLPGSNFLGDLTIRFIVSDQPGVGTQNVDIRVNGAAQVGPAAPVPENTPHEVVIPSISLTNGETTVELEATDKIGNKMATPLTYKVYFTASPELSRGISVAFPDDFAPARIAGMMYGNNWAVAGAGNDGIRVFVMGAGDELIEAAKITEEKSSLVKASDVNGDGTDDLLALGTDAQGKNWVKVFAQTGEAISPVFSEVWGATLDAPGNDIATGFLNPDGYRDIVVALESDSFSVAVAQSADNGGNVDWGTVKYHGGVQRPHIVGIGDFNRDGFSDVLVVKPHSGIVTVFPWDDDKGFLSAGLNSYLTDKPGDMDIVSMLAGDWGADDQGAVPVFADLKSRKWFTGNAAASGKISMGGEFGTGKTPGRMASGDIDRDGRTDIALLCNGSFVVQMFWGNQPPIVVDPFSEGGAGLLAPANATDITLADLTGDDPSKPFLDILLLAGDHLVIIPYDEAAGAENRRFEGPVIVRLGDKPLDVQAGKFSLPDVQLQGFKDLAVLFQDPADSTANVRFLVSSRQYGLPVEDTGSEYNINVTQPARLISADLDGNDYDDLLVPSHKVVPPGTETPTVGRMLVKAGTSHYSIVELDFTDPITGLAVSKGFFAGSNPWVMVLEDLNKTVGTGVLDLAVIAEWPVGDPPKMVPFFQPFVGQGNGTFEVDALADEAVNPEKKPSALAAAKLVGNNYDIVMANSGTNDITIFFAKGLGLFNAKDSEAPNFAVGTAPQKVAAAVIEDPDDSRPDIVTLLQTGVAILYSEGTIGDVTYKTVDYLGLDQPSADDMVLADMNRDGYIDIVTASKSSSQVTVYLNLAFRKYSDPFVFGTGNGPSRLIVTDLDNDTCPDVVTADETGETISILRNLLCQ